VITSISSIIISEFIAFPVKKVTENKGDSVFGEVTNIKRVTMKFLNKSNGVTVNADKSPEKGLGYYNDYDAVVIIEVSGILGFVSESLEPILSKSFNIIDFLRPLRK
jgi:hypothetical protein